MISRRKVIKAGAMGAALVSLPFDRIRRAFGQSAASFDYYISASGDDNNPGTLASPWSITALNSKQSTYAGKNIGIIGDQGIIHYGTAGGVQTTLYSLFQGASGTGNPILALNGGTSAGSPTYIASCTSEGVYSARKAILDASNPSNGALPTVAASIMGQTSYNGSNVTNYGNVTVDGLVLRNFTFAALNFYANTGNSSAASGLVIKNCELYNGQNVVSNNNPGAIWIDYFNGTAVNNCLIHDLQTNAPGTSSMMQSCGYIQFNSQNTRITNCTFYNCCAISNKDGWQSMDVSYCYCGWGPFGQPYSGGSQYSGMGGTIQNYLCGAGATVVFHHNILIGPLLAYGESSQANEGTVLIYNNTFYKPGGIGGSNHGLDVFTDNRPSNTAGGGGQFQFYNNLVYAADANYDGFRNSEWPGAFVKMNGDTGGGLWSLLTNTDHNAYGSGMSFATGWAAGQSTLPLSTWQSYGYDAHSIVLSSSPFTGTPVEAVSASFAIAGPATTAGVGGVVCGACDGSGLIGCDFVGQSVPMAPTLSVG